MNMSRRGYWVWSREYIEVKAQTEEINRLNNMESKGSKYLN